MLLSALTSISPPDIEAEFFLFATFAFSAIPLLIPFPLVGTTKGIAYAAMLTLLTVTILGLIIAGFGFGYPKWTLVGWLMVHIATIAVFLIIAPKKADRMVRTQTLFPSIGLSVSWATAVSIMAKQDFELKVASVIGTGLISVTMCIVYIFLITHAIGLKRQKGVGHGN